jgi:pyruvate formate lyase activating enzyme
MCVKVCTKNAHSIDTQNQTHTLDRSKCVVCGECAQVCYYSSLEIVGKYYTVEEVIDDVMRDKIFYDESGGGMTLSGGEPIYQFFFSQELLKKAKENGLHTAVETSGFGNTLLYGELARYTDLFLYDYKITDNEKHKKYCGVYNDLILKNLEFLNGSNANIILRCPLIDGINTDENHLKAIADLTNKYKNISEVNIEAYHPLGISKNQNIGKEPSYNNSSFMAKEDAAKYTEYIANLTDTKVILQ